MSTTTTTTTATVSTPSPLDSLPPEVLLVFADHLPTSTLFCLSRTCRMLHTLLASHLNAHFKAEAPSIVERAVNEDQPDLLACVLDRNHELLAQMGAEAVDNLLYEAVATQREEVVQLLLDYGADPNGSTYFYTPLIAATDYRNYDMAKILLEAGADVDHLNRSERQTAMRRAYLDRDDELIAFLSHYGPNEYFSDS